MSDTPEIIALVGSYRKGGMNDQIVDAILAGARERGARIRKIYLSDREISFCSNCRSCTQREGRERGICVIDDGMEKLLQEAEHANGLILASPVNAGTVTAVMKRFIERLIGYTWWPWGAAAPKVRRAERTRHAVLVVTSAAPSIMARLGGSAKALAELKGAARLLGAAVSGVLWVGLAARSEHQQIGRRAVQKAHRLGADLVGHS